MGSVDQNQLARLCKRLRLFDLLIMTIIPLSLVWFWSDPENFPLMGYPSVTNYLDGPPTFGKLVAGFTVSMVPAAAAIFWLAAIYRLLGHFAEGCFITHQTTDELKRAGLGLVWFAALLVLHRTAMVLVLTIDRPPGERFINIAILPHDVIALFFGILILVVTRIFTVERERAEDHASIV